MKSLIRKTLALTLVLITTLSLQAQTVEESLQKIAGQISQGISKHNKKRVAVANFLDLQNNVTELGRFLAESFSMELVNSSSTIEVVDRSQLSRLLEELKMSEENLLDPGNATKLGQMAGVEVIITGTISALDNAVYVTAKAIDIQRGIIIAAKQGTIPRTDAINALLRSTVGGGSTSFSKPSASTTMAQGAGDNKLDAVDDVHQTKVTPMKGGNCKSPNGDQYYGYVCFESQMGEDLVLYWVRGLHVSERPNTLLCANGGKAWSPLLKTFGDAKNPEGSNQITFIFQTTGEPVKYGKFIMMAEGCVTKSVVIHPRNLFFSNTY